MHFRNLGNTGLKTSVLGIGSSPFRNGTPEVCARLLEQAAELGINYYDTASSYINGEEAIGSLPANIKNMLVVATKTGARGGKYCLQDLQTSLNKMRRDRIDVWMTHMIETEYEYELCTALGGFCDISVSARQAGLVCATGASFHAPTKVILRAIEERAFDVVMFQLNLIGRETIFGSSIREYRETLLPAAQANGVGVIIMKVLAGAELRHGASNLQFVADPTEGRDVVGGALRYVTLHPHVSSAVVGMAGTDELVANVLAVQGVDDNQFPLFEDWSHQADLLDNKECQRCGTCLGVCPAGIELPKVFRIYDQKRFFGMAGTAHYKYRSLKNIGAACTGCGKCMEVCPEAFDIPNSLRDAHQLLRHS